jgi:hypothetical protein
MISDSNLRSDIRKQIMVEFRNNAGISDSGIVTSLLSDGRRQISAIKDLNSVNSLHLENKSLVNDSIKVKSHYSDNDAWINNSTEGDQRGRLGTNWPWEN